MLTACIGVYLSTGKRRVEGGLCVTAIMLDMMLFVYMAYTI